MRDIDPTEFAALKEEVAALRASVHASSRRPVARPAVGRRPRLRRALVAAGVMALVVAMPMLVSASHQFTDVSTSNTFHASITNLYGARLTGGCASNRFCPNDSVTRGQMAAFLNRSLGRAIGATGGGADDWAALADGPAGSVTLKTGGGPGGTAYVWVHGSLTAWTNESGICPCEIELWLYNSSTAEESAPMWQIIGTEAVSGFYEGAVSVSHLFAVPSGVNVTYSLFASIQSQLSPSPENNAGYLYDMTAMYLPFDWDGTNPEIPEIKPLVGTGRPGHGG